MHAFSGNSDLPLSPTEVSTLHFYLNLFDSFYFLCMFGSHGFHHLPELLYLSIRVCFNFFYFDSPFFLYLRVSFFYGLFLCFFTFAAIISGRSIFGFQFHVSLCSGLRLAGHLGLHFAFSTCQFLFYVIFCVDAFRFQMLA